MVNYNIKEFDGLVGAFYYVWYRDEWKNKTARYLSAKQMPVLGEYDSNDDEVIKQHMKWCRDYGIDFLIVSYDDSDYSNKVIDKMFVYAEKYKIKITFLLETFLLTKTFDMHNSEGLLKDEISRIFESTIAKIASKYFNHNSWLKIRNNPVITLYITRLINSESIFVIDNVRNFIKRNCGFDLHIWADDVFWSDKNNNIKQRWDKHFEHVFCYNPYDARENHGSRYLRGNNYINHIDTLYKKAYDVCSDINCDFIPTIMPRYNDRGVREHKFHDVISSLNINYFLNKVKPYCDKSKFLFVTSFNEWYEDTQIEPCVGKVGYHDFYTNGEPLIPYEYRILEMIGQLKGIKKQTDKNEDLSTRRNAKVADKKEVNFSISSTGSICLKIKTNELTAGTFFCINDSNNSPSMHLTLDKNNGKFSLRYARHSIVHDWLEYIGCTTSIESNKEYEIVLKYGEYNAISVNGELSMVDDERFDFKQFPTKNFSFGDVLRPQNNANGLTIESVCFKDRQGKVYYEDENCNFGL